MQETLEKKSNVFWCKKVLFVFLFNLSTFYLIKPFIFNAEIQVLNSSLVHFINLLLKTVQF
jgi:hypothetical protein